MADKKTTSKETTELETSEDSNILLAAQWPKERLIALRGKPFSSAIYGYEIGCKAFKITLNGQIEKRPFTDDKGITTVNFYLCSKQGISIKVNDSYDNSVHKDGAIFYVVVKGFPTTDAQGNEIMRKYAVFASEEEIAAAKNS